MRRVSFRSIVTTILPLAISAAAQSAVAQSAAAQSPAAQSAAAQPPPPNFHLPPEAAGIDGIVHALLDVFNQADVVALGEAHRRKLDSDLRIALVRDPAFAKIVHSIVVEFASTTEQPLLDRYIRGENVSSVQLAQVWRTTTQAPNGIWDDPMYRAFFAAVRDVNSKLPPGARIRVLGGDPGPGDNRGRETAAVAVLKEQVLHHHSKALVIYGAAHFYRNAPKDYWASMGQDVGIARMLEMDYPGRTLAVIPVGFPPRLPPGAALPVDPDYRKFDRALKTRQRPVLVPLDRLPFRDFTAEEFLGGGVFNCRGPGGCVSMFKGSNLTLGLHLRGVQPRRQLTSPKAPAVMPGANASSNPAGN